MARLKNQEGKPWGKAPENLFVSVFKVELQKQVSETLKRNLQAAVPVLCRFLFNLIEITIVKKNNSSFLLVKMKCMRLIFVTSF